MDGLTRRTSRRLATVAFAALLLLGGAVSDSSAQLVRVIGEWTEPFEEGGAGTPRCVPAQGDTAGFVVCKPTAAASAMLPDGRVLYYNGFESQENAKGPSAMSLFPSVRDNSVAQAGRSHHSHSPAHSPALPLAAVGMAAVATLMGRRWALSRN